MKEKLVVEVDSALLKKAEQFGKAHGKPVSRLIEDYFIALDESEQVDPEAKALLPPLTAKIVGALKGSRVSEEDYYKHLEEKYLWS